jgi:hypothetical protein
MATYTKNLLSESTNGIQIKITSITSGSANTIHTSVSGSSNLDEIWLYAYNDDIAAHTLSILWGGIVEPDNVIRTLIQPKAGRTLITDGMLLQNNLMVKGYADVSGSIMIDGFVNSIT